MASNTVDVDSTQEEPGSRGKLRSALITLAILILAGQGVGIYVLMTKSNADEEEVEAPVQVETSEVSLENFNCTNNVAVPGADTNINLFLVVTIADENLSEFTTANGKRPASIRQAVLEVLRSSTQDELQEHKLPTMKRRIKQQINKVLEKDWVEDVVIPEFRTHKQ